MDLKDIITIAWRRRLAVVVTIVVAVAVAAGYAFTATKQYQSSETIVLTPNVRFQSGQVGANSLTTLLPTYGAVAESPTTKGAAGALLGHPLRASISSSTTAGTGILQIRAQSPSPTDAQQAANAVSRAFIQRLGTRQVLVAQVVAPAALPTAPVAPRKSLIIGVGLLLGIALGLTLALVLDRWFDRVTDAGDVTAATGLSCLGQIPQNRALRGGGPHSLVWGDKPELFPLQEAMRSLRTTLQFSMGAESQVLQVTSPSPGEGKSTVAANLAVAIASLGIQTTLIDADFWAPRQHLIFSVSNARGLSGAIGAGRSDARIPAQRTPFRNLRLITTGPLPANPTELIAAGIESVLDRARKLGSVVILDTPPALGISDSRLIAAQVDSVLLVARAGETKSSVLRLAVEQLQLAQSHVEGVVLNGVAKLPPAQALYGGYYMPPAQGLAVAQGRSSSSDS